MTTRNSTAAKDSPSRYMELQVTETVAKITALTETKFEKLTRDLKDDIKTTLSEVVREAMGGIATDVSDMKVSMASIVSENLELKASVTELQGEVTTLKAELTNVNERIDTILKENKTIVVHQKDTNLVLYGVEETQSENVLDKVKQILSDELKIENVNAISFRNVFRMGKFDKDSAFPRPIKLQILSMYDKRQIFGAYLKGRDEYLKKGLRMRDDLPLYLRKFRSECYPLFDAIIKCGKTPKYRGDGVRVVMSPNSFRDFESVASLKAFVDELERNAA